jgi:branched-chain amino acid aminotransferase
MLMVLCSPVGPYYRTGFAAVSLLADPINIRAWPGGVGDCKVGGNYAPGILPQLKAAGEGFQQNLWLFPLPGGEGHQVTEVGTMNCFVYWKNENGVCRFSITCCIGWWIP